MSFIQWLALIGFVLLSMAFASVYLRRVPISSAMIYLAFGAVLGPSGARLLAYDALTGSRWLEHFTTVVVVVSLFIGGLKLRLPLRDPAWRAAYRLAGPVMLLSIAGVALVAQRAFGLELAAAMLLGALLAPTDPVLAGEVSVADASDHDRLRYALSGEAGLNDGAAFPFVVFALEFAAHGGTFGAWVGRWAVHRLLWAVPVGLLGGFALGWIVGRLAIHVRAQARSATAASDFLALSLIALAYAGAESIGAWGFLAVFAAGAGLRRAEVATVRRAPAPPLAELRATPTPRTPDETPSEALVERELSARAVGHPAVAAGAMVSEVLSFGDTLERILEVVVVILVGALVRLHWDARAIWLAAALFFIVRPISTLIGLAGTPTQRPQRALIAWFGIRGIGSVYYLAYALRHGFAGGRANEVADLTLSVVALSIVAHGVTEQPLLARYEEALRKGER